MTTVSQGLSTTAGATQGTIALRPEREIVAGRTYRMWFPFKMGEHEHVLPPDGGDGPWQRVTTPSWIPGWTYEQTGPEDAAMCWDGEGAELRTVVSLHRPPGFPERVFYVRQWEAPDGYVFGRRGLRIVVASAFRRWMTGARWSETLRYDPGRAKASLKTFMAMLLEEREAGQ